MLEMGDVPKVAWQQPGFMFSVHASMKEHGLRCFRQRSACAIFLLFSFSTLDYFLRKRWRSVSLFCLCAACESRSKHPSDLCKQASNSTLGACRCLVVWHKKRRCAYQCQCRNDRGTQNKNLTRAREIEKNNGYKINVEAGVPTGVGVR